MFEFALVAGAVLLAQVEEQPTTAPPTKAGLTIENLYNGINRPVMINAVSPRTFGKVSLVLMNAEGSVIGVPVEVYPGRIDLAEVMPNVWELDRAAFLQMVDLDGDGVDAGHQQAARPSPTQRATAPQTPDPTATTPCAG